MTIKGVVETSQQRQGFQISGSNVLRTNEDFARYWHHKNEDRPCWALLAERGNLSSNYFVKFLHCTFRWQEALNWLTYCNSRANQAI